MSRWNKEKIAAERREKLTKELADATPEQLIERIVELETALYPFACVCGSLDSKSWRGTSASSKLFPLFTDNNNFTVYEGDGKSKEVTMIRDAELHEIDYYEADSITITDGSQLHDDFEVLAVHQQAPGAYVGCGSITMSDVRAAVSLIFPHREHVQS